MSNQYQQVTLCMVGILDAMREDRSLDCIRHIKSLTGWDLVQCRRYYHSLRAAVVIKPETFKIVTSPAPQLPAVQASDERSAPALPAPVTPPPPDAKYAVTYSYNADDCSYTMENCNSLSHAEDEARHRLENGATNALVVQVVMETRRAIVRI